MTQEDKSLQVREIMPPSQRIWTILSAKMILSLLEILIQADKRMKFTP